LKTLKNINKKLNKHYKKIINNKYKILISKLINHNILIEFLFLVVLLKKGLDFIVFIYGVNN